MFNPDPEIRESSSSSSSCSSSIYWLLRREKSRSSWQLFCSVCVTVRIREVDDEHENEDDFATSEFRFNGLAARVRQRPSGIRNSDSDAEPTRALCQSLVGSDLRADRSPKATHRKTRSPRRCDPTCPACSGQAAGHVRAASYNA